jgi:hypothetical protein
MVPLAANPCINEWVSAGQWEELAMKTTILAYAS